MQDKIELIKELAQKAEDFVRTNVELYRLKAIDKGTDVFSSIASAFVIGLVFIFFITMFSFAAAFWFGDILGSMMGGFLTVAGIYFVIGLLLVFTRKSVEQFFNDYIVKQIFKEKNHEGN